MKDFVALDFETADNGRDSACAIGLVRVSGGEIVKRTYYLIKPRVRALSFPIFMVFIGVTLPMNQHLLSYGQR